MSSRFKEALAIAERVHLLQLDKGGESSFSHVLRVSEQFENESHKIVAILHDSLEDFEGPKEELLSDIYSKVQLTFEEKEALLLITRSKEDTYFEYIAKQKAISKEVKVADILDHLDPIRVHNLADSMIKRYEKALRILV